VSRTGLIWEPACLEHRTGIGHPEAPQRLRAIRAGLEEAGLWSRCQRLRARPVSRAELLRCHSASYLDLVERELAQGRPQLSSGDTPLSAGTAQAAALAAGGGLTAVEAVLAGTVANAFVALRPPGHHATAERGMGFCLYNNVAVAARHAQAVCGVERVLILDWDVHHGNGTQAIFWRDPSVLYCSVHQMPLYPGSGLPEERGEGPGAGATLNLPLPAGAAGQQMLQALRNQLDPLLEGFRPQLVLVSAGFDAMAGDPLADLRLSAADVTALTELALGYAERDAQGRLVSLLEGGYNLHNLAAAAVAHVGALLAGPVAAG
jgi:acetoin utilization deacetylase AcuC-like enzyme